MAGNTSFNFNFVLSDGIWNNYGSGSIFTPLIPYTNQTVYNLNTDAGEDFNIINFASLEGRFFVNFEANKTAFFEVPRMVFSESTSYYKYNELDEWTEITENRLGEKRDFSIASFHPISSEFRWFSQPISWYNQNLNKDFYLKMEVKVTFTDVATTPGDGELYYKQNSSSYIPSEPLNLSLYKNHFTEYSVKPSTSITFLAKISKTLPSFRDFTIDENGDTLKPIKFIPNNFSDNFKYKKITYSLEGEYSEKWYYQITPSPSTPINEYDYRWYSNVDSTSSVIPKTQFVIFPNDSTYNQIKWYYKEDGNNDWVEFHDSNLEFEYTFNKSGTYTIKIEANNTDDQSNLVSYVYPNPIIIDNQDGRINGKIALSVLLSPFTNNIISENDRYYDNYLDIHDSFDETSVSSEEEIFNELINLDKFYFGNIVDSDTNYQNSLINVSREDKPTIIFDFDDTKLKSEKYNYPLLYIPYNKFSNERVIVGSIANLNSKNPFKDIEIKNDKFYFCPRNVSIIGVENDGPLINVETGEEE